MIKKAIASLLMLYFSACSLGTRYERTETINAKLGAGYALTHTPEGRHGFETRFKKFVRWSIYDIEEDKEYRESEGKIKERGEVSFSREYSFRGLFGKESNLYEFGVTSGVGFYNKEATSSLELIVAPLRMGITSKGQAMWTPSLGINIDLVCFYVQPRMDFFIGPKEEGRKGIGFGLGAGLSTE